MALGAFGVSGSGVSIGSMSRPPKSTTLDVRKRQLAELEDRLASVKNRRTIVEDLQDALDKAKKPAVRAALQKELEAAKGVTGGPELKRQIEIIRAWILAEEAYQTEWPPRIRA